MPSPEPLPDRCGARCRGGGYCTQRKMPNGRCKMHGGLTPSGADHPAFRHGRYSKIWGRFADVVEAAMDDEDLLDARAGVAGALAAMEEAAERLQKGDTPEFRKRVQALHREGMALLREDPPAALAKLRELSDLIDRGVREDRAFRDLVNRSDMHRRAVNDAIKLKFCAGAAMNIGELRVFLDALIDILIQVAGREVACEVMSRFDRERLGGRIARMSAPLGAEQGAASQLG